MGPGCSGSSSSSSFEYWFEFEEGNERERKSGARPRSIASLGKLREFSLMENFSGTKLISGIISPKGGVSSEEKTDLNVGNSSAAGTEDSVKRKNKYF